MVLLPLGEGRGVSTNEDEIRGIKNVNQRSKFFFHEEKAVPKRELIHARL